MQFCIHKEDASRRSGLHHIGKIKHFFCFWIYKPAYIILWVLRAIYIFCLIVQLGQYFLESFVGLE